MTDYRIEAATKEEWAARALAAEEKLGMAMQGLKESRDEIDRYIVHEYPSDHPVHERYRKRDFAANPARITIAAIRAKDATA